jgi:CRISPR/Cas system CSM-associated protein Csm4 (group 5 of RAMP superfamily)
LKISDKKSVSNHAFKITAHENCVALSIIFYQSLIKTNHHVKQKTIKKIEFMEIHACSSALVAFYAVSSKCRAQEKRKKNITMKVESKHPVTATSEMHQENDSIKKN